MIYFWWVLDSLIALAGVMIAEHIDSKRDMTRLAFIIWCLVCSIPFINVLLAWFSAPLYKKKK